MIKFEDKFVHFRWTDDLEGKHAFYGNSVAQLEQHFASVSSLGRVLKSTSQEYPFEIEGVGIYTFIYYDPNYDCKVAYNEGKQIQGRNSSSRCWTNMPFPGWDDGWEYRIKPGLTWTDLHIGDTVRKFNGSLVSMVTAFDMAESTKDHVQLAGWGWTSDNELSKEWYKL